MINVLTSDLGSIAMILMLLTASIFFVSIRFQEKHDIDTPALFVTALVLLGLSALTLLSATALV